jgi:cysteine desulfurase
VTDRELYFDYNATTPVDPRVREVMQETAANCFGNPSSSHARGQQAAQVLSRARCQVAGLLGGEPGEICFTAGGSEADNLALKGVVLPLLLQRRKVHIVTSAVEHPAIRETCIWLERYGAEVTRLPVSSDGTLPPEQVVAALRPETRLVSLMLANNETGVLFPLAEIGKFLRERGILLHCDAVQAAGKIAIDVQRLQVDLLSISGHKLYAPKGVGALWVRSGVGLEPLIHGGGQEHGMRAGTENLCGIAAFGQACDLVVQGLADESRRILHLRDELEKKLDEALDHQLVFHGHRQQRVPNTSSLSVPYVDSESLLTYLDIEGVAISAGSACASNEHQGSPVLQALGVAPELARGAVRISLGRWSSQAGVERLTALFADAVRRLWSISPLYCKQA